MPVDKLMLSHGWMISGTDFTKNRNPHLPTNYFHFSNYGLYGHAKG